MSSIAVVSVYHRNPRASTATAPTSFRVVMSSTTPFGLGTLMARVGNTSEVMIAPECDKRSKRPDKLR